MNRAEIKAFWVSEFIAHSDAILSIKEGAGDHWRVQVLAVRAFREEVFRMKDWGYLLYLHDGCSLAKKGGAA